VLQRNSPLLAEEKDASIGSEYLFAPIAVETLGALNTSACQLFGNLGKRSPQRQAMKGKELFCPAESFGAGATLQRCLVTLHLASPSLHS